MRRLRRPQPGKCLSRRSLLSGLAACAFVLPCWSRLRAQQRESALSDGEVEKLRDTAQDPPNRVMAFVSFLNQRADQIEKLTTGKRQPGREEDIHDLMEQMGSILDDLGDNLDDYSQRHQDIRKVLPKLVSATERWATVLKTPPDNEQYNVSRKLTLESLGDVHESAVKMIDEQKAWFLEHPPSKEKKQTGNNG
jgi:hypothetical protein